MSHVEPSADLRRYAHFLRQMFVALTEQGFSEQQALAVVGHVIHANLAGGGAA